MAAIIAQLTLNARRRKERGKSYLGAEKSNYILKRFDPQFQPDKHNRYRVNKTLYDGHVVVRDAAKDLAQSLLENDLEFYYFRRYGKIPNGIKNPEMRVDRDALNQKCTIFNVLKAFTAGFGLLLFTVVFVFLAFVGFDVETIEFVLVDNSTLNRNKFVYN